MKWRKEASSDGVYLTFSEKLESFGILILKDKKWYARTREGVVLLPSIKNIDFFLKIVRPKK